MAERREGGRKRGGRTAADKEVELGLMDGRRHNGSINWRRKESMRRVWDDVETLVGADA
jgi:hypothetical protein